MVNWTELTYEAADWWERIVREMLQEDFAVVYGEKENEQGEMRRLYDEMADDPMRMQAWIDGMRQHGYSEEEITGWLTHQAILKMRRMERRNG